ncbi:response regulator [Permianibacter sp. IMCC34836]|uniref:response regulator n=1 Tax=Permianibacter fluminis TaxID=2738515 RepID=UPI001555E731|nr:response regulator [Permianibacter fluminis]NQD37680.1 response regulator [Permianibacter fluminis]
MRLLLAEDDSLLGEGIVTALRRAGYSVDWFRDGSTVGPALQNEHFDLVVLDLGLPKMDGMDVLRQIRKRGDLTPVLILTARDDLDDRVAGLDAGADDYLGKPFSVDELLARLRALQRRRGGRADNLLQHGDLTVDPASHRVELAGTPIVLPRREFALLHALLEHRGNVLSREQLEQTLYSWEDEVGSNTIEVHVHHLRKKLGNDLIRTVRGIGYTIDSTTSPQRDLGE